jgi:hypothetical protein
MSSPHNNGAAPTGQLLPPIDHLPDLGPRDLGSAGLGPAGKTQSNPDVLAGFAASARPWDQLPVPLSAPVTRALWIVLIASGGIAGWLIAVLSDAAPCRGFACAVATLGGRPVSLLVLAGSCVLALLGAAVVTRGLTQAGAAQLAVIAVAAIAGIVSLLGVAALLVLVALGIRLVWTVLTLFVDGTS